MTWAKHSLLKLPTCVCIRVEQAVRDGILKLICEDNFCGIATVGVVAAEALAETIESGLLELAPVCCSGVPTILRY